MSPVKPIKSKKQKEKHKKQQSTASSKSKVKLATVAAKVKPFSKLVRSVSPLPQTESQKDKENKIWKEEYSKQCTVITQLK